MLLKLPWHHPAEPLARHREEAARAHVEVHVRVGALARLTDEVEVKPRGPKPWESHSKFEGLLGG
jgi:hypothetical protein